MTIFNISPKAEEVTNNIFTVDVPIGQTINLFELCKGIHAKDKYHIDPFVSVQKIGVKAQEVLKALKDVSGDERTEEFLEEYKGRRWLPVDNILNGHQEAPEDYKVLLEKLSDGLHDNLINPKGGNSNTYHELKVAGFKLWVTERDSFGPLGCAITCPYEDWSVSYG